MVIKSAKIEICGAFGTQRAEEKGIQDVGKGTTGKT
jgi:hypothetical protein